MLVSTTRESIWTGRLGATTAGIFALAFLFAFESLAVLTAMPVVVSDLDGLSWYAVSFAAPMAVSIISLTFAGAWCDAVGPRRPMAVGVVVFSVGLVVAGVATSMPVFLVGRGIQGAGQGLAGVALYVVIGQMYPDHLRPRAFAVLTSAWTLPALVGPVVAGSVAEHVGWRWVFLSVPALALVCLVVLMPSLRAAGSGSGDRVRAATGTAVVLALGVLALTVAGQRGVAWWPALLVVAVGVIGLSARRLLPAGTWAGGRGLPSVLATRGLLAAGFTGAEAYLPLSLVEHRDLGVAAAGACITGAAFTWFAGAWSAANVEALAERGTRVSLGSTCIVVGTLASAGSLVDVVPLWLIVVGWSVGGFGMGMALSTLSVLVIDLSEPHEQGVNSAAMQLNDQTAESTMLAIGSVVFAGLLATDPMLGYVLVLAGATAVTLAAFVPQRRMLAPGRPKFAG